MQKTWKQLNEGFFRGNDFRPTSLNEKLAIAVIGGMVAWITIERIVWYFMGNLKLFF